MTKLSRNAWVMSILWICSFLLFGGYFLRTLDTGTAMGYRANFPEIFTVSTGEVAGRIVLATESGGEIASEEFTENERMGFLLDGVDMIYFEGIDGDGFIPFHFRCDGKEWQECAEILWVEQLGDCERLELFVGELPIEEYTVTYTWGEERKSVTVTAGEGLEEWIPPVPEGKRFTGWYEEERKYDFDEKVHKDMTLTARFEEAVCRLTYHVDDEEWATETYGYGTEIELKRPKGKEGYRFVGWEDPAGIAGSTITITEDICLRAVWTKIYTVSFYDEDGLLESVAVDEGGIVTPVSVPEREGYEFTGWFWEETLFDFTEPIREDAVLVAKYVGIRFRVDFYIRGVLYLSAECTYPKRLELFTPPPIEGEVFREWRYEDGEIAEEGDAVNRDLILTAIYEKAQVSIRFHLHGNDPEERKAIYGAPCVLPNVPQVTGYRFLHWSEEEDGAEYVFPSVWAEVEDRDFYAVYVANSYTVTYLSEGAAVAGPRTGKYGERVTFSVTPEEGLRVIKLELYRDGRWEELEDCAFLMPAEDVRVRVTTEIHSYALEVVADGKTYSVEQGETFTPPTPERENRIFLGWFTDVDCTQEYGGTVTGEEGERIYLYAKFEKVKFTVTFRAGEREERILCAYGEVPQPPFVPWEEETDKRFVKWSSTVVEAVGDAEYEAIYESVYTKIYFDREKEIFRETVVLSESNAPTLVLDGYQFDGYRLVRQESDVLYYYARLFEIPKSDTSTNPPDVNPTPTATPPTTIVTAKTSAKSSGLPVWVALAVLSIGAWVVYLGVRIYRRKNK